MSIEQALLALMLALPGNMTPERVERLSVISAAIADVSDGDAEMAATLWVIGDEESGRFARSVHAGEKRGDGGRSICLAQIRQKAGGKQWASLAGLDPAATRRCFARAASLVRSGRAYCEKRSYRGSLRRAAMSMYGSGKGCNAWFRGSSRRNRRIEAVLRGLRLMGVQ